MPRNWQELYEDEVNTAIPTPSWQQNYESSLSGAKQAVEPGLLQRLWNYASGDPGTPSTGSQLLDIPGGFVRGLGQGMRTMERVRKYGGMIDESGKPVVSDAELLEGARGMAGSLNPMTLAGGGSASKVPVVLGVTPNDTTFVNYIRQVLPKFMKRVDALPDIQFTRGWRGLANAKGEARAQAEFRPPSPTSFSQSAGGSIEIGLPFTETREGKWVVPPSQHLQEPLPEGMSRAMDEMQQFVHEAFHALYWHKEQAGRASVGPEQAVPSMEFGQAIDFMESLVRDGYLSRNRMDQYIHQLGEVRHGALEGMAWKLVKDVFEPDIREAALVRRREPPPPRKSLKDIIRALQNTPPSGPSGWTTVND